MPRRFTDPKLVIASHNPGKVREIADLLVPYAVDVVSAGGLGLPEPEETGATFTANALLKSEAAAQGAGLPALADDSGACGARPRRRAGHILGALGRSRARFHGRHGTGRA